MTSTTDDALLVAHQQWIEAWKHNDPAALLSILAADVVLMPPNDTAIYGIVEAREWLHEYFEHFQIIGLAVMDRHVTLIDDLSPAGLLSAIKQAPTSCWRGA